MADTNICDAGEQNEMALSIKKIDIHQDYVAFNKKKGTDTFRIVIDVEALGRVMCTVATSSGRLGYGNIVL